MKARRATRGRFSAALAASLVVHAAIVGVALLTARRVEPLPEMRVYAVDIVSPPPQQEGEWSPEPTVAPEPEPEPPQPDPEPEPEPTPPEPEPSPAPPTRKPEPEKPTPPKPAEKPQPKPAAEEPKPEPARPKPSTGRNPDPASTGGEGLNYELKGVQCPSPEYCNNIIRQVNRYFRPAGGATGDAEVYFVINRDGSVDDFRVLNSRGGAAFRLAVMEAVEQAGINKAFGPLPRAFPGDELPVSFYFRPAR